MIHHSACDQRGARREGLGLCANRAKKATTYTPGAVETHAFGPICWLGIVDSGKLLSLRAGLKSPFSPAGEC